MIAAIVIAIALLVGAALVASQLVRLRAWLGKAPAEPAPDADDEGRSVG